MSTMHRRRALALSLLATAFNTALAAQATLFMPAGSPPVPRAPQTEVAAAKPALTPEAMEAFLLTAKIAEERNAGKGVTGSRRATLSDGTITHDAHIQVVDVAKAVFAAGGRTELNFKDTYRFNIAGYRLARLVGLDSVPVSVERRIDSTIAAVTWWVDDVLMDEQERMKRNLQAPDPQRMVQQHYVMRVWDELVQNKDRNQGNILYTTDWKMWLIDHTRAFRLERQLQKPDQLLRCDRALLEALRRLTKDAAAKATKGSLQAEELNAVMARRDALVRHFDALIAARGEASVLFTR